MKKILLPVLLLVMFFVGCKKENTLTADDKPVSDAANNVLRIDISAAIPYKLGILVFDTGMGSNAMLLTYNHNADPYEYMTRISAGKTVDINIQAEPFAKLTCLVYYKGLKVPANELKVIANDGNDAIVSRIHISYDIVK